MYKKRAEMVIEGNVFIRQQLDSCLAIIHRISESVHLWQVLSNPAAAIATKIKALAKAYNSHTKKINCLCSLDFTCSEAENDLQWLFQNAICYNDTRDANERVLITVKILI